MEVIKSYNLFLDSSQMDYSDAGNPASYMMYLRKPITKSSKSSQFRLKIFQACIPFSFTEINTSNNVLSYTFNSSPFQLTIPIGSYSITALLSYLQTYLNTTHSVSLSFTFNTSTNLSTLGFSASGNSGTKSFTFSTTGNNLLVMKQLGFVNTTATFSYTSGILVNATSNQSVNVSPSKNLYIRSDNLQQGQNAQEAISTKIIMSDIVAIVPINVPYGNYINFYDSTAFQVYINNETIDSVSLYLTDATSDDTLTGLQLNWSCSMSIEEVLIKQEIDTSHITSTHIDNKNLIKDLETDKQQSINDLEKEKERLLNEIKSIKNRK